MPAYRGGGSLDVAAVALLQADVAVVLQLPLEQPVERHVVRFFFLLSFLN